MWKHGMCFLLSGLFMVSCATEAFEQLNRYDKTMLLSVPEIVRISGIPSGKLETGLKLSKETFYDCTFHLYAEYDPEEEPVFFQQDISFQYNFSESLLSGVGSYMLDKMLKEEFSSILKEEKKVLQAGDAGLEITRYVHQTEGRCYAFTLNHSHAYKKFHIMIINPQGIPATDAQLVQLLEDKVKMFQSVEIGLFKIMYGTNSIPTLSLRK